MLGAIVPNESGRTDETCTGRGIHDAAIPLAFHYRNNVFQSKEGTLHVDIEDHFKGFGRIILYIGRDSFDPRIIEKPSILPNFSTVASTYALTSSSLATLACSAIALESSDPNRRLLFNGFQIQIDQGKISTLFRQLFAAAVPIPPAAPVITITFPSNLLMVYTS